MGNYINKPIKSNDWDPSKGDYISTKIILDDKIHRKKIKRKKVYISLLALLHIILLAFVISL